MDPRFDHCPTCKVTLKHLSAYNARIHMEKHTNESKRKLEKEEVAKKSKNKNKLCLII